MCLCLCVFVSVLVRVPLVRRQVKIRISCLVRPCGSLIRVSTWIQKCVWCSKGWNVLSVKVLLFSMNILAKFVPGKLSVRDYNCYSG